MVQNTSKVTCALKDTENLKGYCDGLMREMLWGEPATTVMLYHKRLAQKEEENKSPQRTKKSPETVSSGAYYGA